MTRAVAAHAQRRIRGTRSRRATAGSVLKVRTAGEVAQRTATTRFRSLVWDYWKKNGRHDLPWRLPSLKLRQGKKNFDPYRILVSEVMLQQTQVSRVIGKYKEFLKKFPTVRVLARASLSDVLRVWSEMGYNRRAKYLRDAAKIIVEKHKGKVPVVYSELVELPGVGNYTARAVRVFAFNEPDVLIETNIRTVLIHTFYSRSTLVTDQELMTLLSKVIDKREPREWYWALMDYGAYLKRAGIRNNHKSAYYVRQSKFEGSLRQARGEVIKHLANGFSIDLVGRYSEALAGLERDGLVVSQKGKWRIG